MVAQDFHPSKRSLKALPPTTSHHAKRWKRGALAPRKQPDKERPLGPGPRGKIPFRFISPDELAGGRGDLTPDGNHWTYLAKPTPTLTGNWSRVESFILDPDHIRFEEYESTDGGKTWTKTNSGTEERTAA